MNHNDDAIESTFGSLAEHLTEADLLIERTNGFAVYTLQLTVMLREILGDTVDNVLYRVDCQDYDADGDIHCTLYFHREHRPYESHNKPVFWEVARMQTDSYQIKTFDFMRFSRAYTSAVSSIESLELFLRTAAGSAGKRVSIAKESDGQFVITLHEWSYESSSEESRHLCHVYESAFDGSFTIELI